MAATERHIATDLYRILEVDPSADLEAIHAAYRRLARLHHPDLNPRPEAAERMSAVNAAYRVLSDPARRAAYDARRYFHLERPPATVGVREGAPPPTAAPPGPRPAAKSVAYESPTALQRRVDRIVAVVGVVLLVVIGAYAVVVIPRSEQDFQDYVRGFRSTRPAPLATAVPSTQHASGVAVPQRLASDSGLRSFPGTVLVAPSDLEPFADLPVLRLDATGQGIARYAIYYGDLTNGGATISGLVGRASFDSAEPRLPDCAAEAAYCAGPAPGQPSSASSGVELFRASGLVETYPAFVIHRVCCNGLAWSVSWYEPRANMSYTIDLSRSVAARFGSPSADADGAAARVVAALATQLVRLP